MPRKDRASLVQAYREIKGRIVRLDLRPGQRLDDYELAEQLPISRTPVREALFLLAAEGLVDIRPGVGFVVRQMDLLDISQVFEAHIVIARVIARLAARRIKPDELEEMHVVAQRIAAAHLRRDYLAITQANARFHQLEAGAAHSEHLKRFADLIRNQTHRLAYLGFGGEPALRPDMRAHFARVDAQHQDLLAALGAHDADGAEAAAVAHVRLFRERLQQFLGAGATDAFAVTADDLAIGDLALRGAARNGRARRPAPA